MFATCNTRLHDTFPSIVAIQQRATRYVPCRRRKLKMYFRELAVTFTLDYLSHLSPALFRRHIITGACTVSFFSFFLLLDNGKPSCARHYLHGSGVCNGSCVLIEKLALYYATDRWGDICALECASIYITFGWYNFGVCVCW